MSDTTSRFGVYVLQPDSLTDSLACDVSDSGFYFFFIQDVFGVGPL